MTESTHQTVTLVRAGGAVDLWSVIEAAQYGHLLAHDDFSSDAERRAFARFAETFGNATEAWEDTAPENRQTLLRSLEPALAELQRCGLHLHHAIVQRHMISPAGTTVALAIAVVNVGHGDEPEMTASIPRHLTASG